MSVWRAPVTLTGRSVVLRPLCVNDADALTEAAEGLTDLFFANVSGLSDPPAFVAAALREHEYGRALPFVVETPDAEVIGMTRFMRMNEAHRRLEIGGTFYARSVQRTGVNTEAKLLLLTHAFDVLGCNAVQLRTDWFNHRSQAAIERLGAKRDGVLRSHQLMDGRVRDVVVYSIIAGEWPGVRRKIEFLLRERYRDGNHRLHR